MTRKEFEEKYLTQRFGCICLKRLVEFPLTGKKTKWGSEEYDYSDEAQVIDDGWQLYLEHQCDEWIIGNSEEAEKFVKDLVEAIEYSKNNP